MSIWTGRFWRAAVERSVKTVAQTAAAMLGADGLGITDADWLGVGSVSLMAGVVSVLTSIGSAGATDGSPSLTDAERLTPPKIEPPDPGYYSRLDRMDGLR